MYIHKLKIGNVELENNILLAPMAGITDLAFRKICKEYGNPGLVYTEMASSRAIFHNDEKTKKLLDVEGEKRPIAVSEVSGVAEMAGGFAGGITEVLSGKKNLAKGIKVETKEGETKIDVNIIVEYGVRIPDVAFEIQNKVKKSVEEKTGLKVSGVNVHIQGVKTEINEPQEIIVDGKNEEK